MDDMGEGKSEARFFIGLTGVREGKNDGQYIEGMCMERQRDKKCGHRFLKD